MSSKRVVDLRNRKTPQQEPRLVPVRFSAPGPKRTPLRVKRRRTKYLISAAIVVFLALVAGGISWVSYLPQYSVQKISVTGVSAVPPDLIDTYMREMIANKKYSYISHQNIFFYHPQSIARALVIDFPRIKTARVYRRSLFATQVEVAITERQPSALWCSSGACYQMDETGFIFAEAQPQEGTSTPSQYVFGGGLAATSSPIGQVFVQAHLPGILSFMKLLAQVGYKPLGATIENERDFSVSLSESFLIKASYGQDTNMLLKNLQLVLSSDALNGKQADIEYVDLRFGNKVYYKLRSSAAETSPTQ